MKFGRGLVVGFALMAVISVGVTADAQQKPRLSELRDIFDSHLVAGEATANGESQPYKLYVPPEYTADREWPLIVFLHGIGERGDDGVRQTRVGIGPAIQRFAERFPCLVLMPQCSPAYYWTNEVSMGQIDDAIRQVREQYSVDTARIVLTGLSMGGFGTFGYGAKNIDSFSCTVPICGGGNVEDAKALAQRPMKVFHGDADTIVIPARSREMVEAVRAAGGTVTYTEYPGVGHNSWDKAYRDPETIAWMLAQTKPAK